MRPLLASLLAGSALLASPAAAADRPIVIELFTSQGCPSCPPADGFFQKLAELDDVLALSLHVDYWDYIGWEDTFASPVHTARQRGYASAAGRKMVYTPQMILDGTDHVVATRYQDVTDLIDKHRGQRDGGLDGEPANGGIELDVTRDGAALHLQARAQTPRDMPLVVQLARYLPQETVEIERGENAGRTITYVNIVTDLVKVAEWDTRAPLDLRIDWPGDTSVAVLLQYPDHGRIEAAVDLP